jgi:hypothetical protein
MAFRQPYPLDHATHLPVLIGVGIIISSILSVVEYGAGLYSTPVFLNRQVFPNLELLKSFEPDNEWAEKVYAEVKSDARCSIYATDKLPVFSDGLVFIDNGPFEHKINTIRKVFESNFPGLVIIHDSEVQEYKKEFCKFSCYHEFMSFCPETVICCNRLIAPSIERLGSIISEHSDVPCVEVQEWIRIFRGYL